MIVIGRRRTYVHVQRPRDRRTDAGDIVHEFETVGQAWLELEGLGGREFWQAQLAQSTATHRGTMRFDAAITADYRLKLVGTQRILNIVSVVDPGGRSRELRLVVTEVVA